MITLLRTTALAAALTVAAGAQATGPKRESAPKPSPSQLLTIGGVLMDAGCIDRSEFNLGQQPESPGAKEPAQPQAASASQKAPAMPNGATPSAGASGSGASAYGISVDQKTLDTERGDVMAHHVPDLQSRQPDPTCAVTGATRGFALLTDKGRLLDLDEGGNTWAAEALQATASGQKLLNANGPGMKPRVEATGRIQGDHLIVDKLEIR